MNIHQRRIDLLNEIEARDDNRFKQNPNGEGYLTRAERYQEARNECRRRIGAKMSKSKAPDGGTADMVGERPERPKLDDLIELAEQYRRDMLWPPDLSSRMRRIRWIDSVIGPDDEDDKLER